jgi:hypothetical protein
MSLRTAAQVADELHCSEWTVLELVRQKKIPCVRLTTGESANRGLVRFTDEHVAQIVSQFTVETPTSIPARRRKRRSA